MGGKCSVDPEGLVVDEFGLVGGLPEVVQDGRVRGVPNHVVGHEGLLLGVQCGLAADTAEVFLADPGLFQSRSRQRQRLRRPLIL